MNKIIEKNVIPAMRIPTDQEWDLLMDVTHEDDVLSHWKKMYSWVNDKENRYGIPASARAVRGYGSARFWSYRNATYQNVTVGFRPAVDLEPGALSSDIRDGESVVIGTLYMDGKPVRVPQKPTWDGDIMDYTPNAKLELRPALEDPAYQVTAIMVDVGVAVADRNLLKCISYEDLEGMWLERIHPVWISAPAAKSVRVLDIGNVCKALFEDLRTNYTATQSGDGFVTDYHSICEIREELYRDISVSLIQRKAEDGGTPYLELHVIDNINDQDCYMKDVNGLDPEDVLNLTQKAQDAVATALWEIIRSSGVMERPSTEAPFKQPEVKASLSCERLHHLLNVTVNHMVEEEGGNALRLLLNIAIGSMIEKNGNCTYRVAGTLLELGFTKDELVNEFQFPESDVN